MMIDGWASVKMGVRVVTALSLCGAAMVLSRVLGFCTPRQRHSFFIDDGDKIKEPHLLPQCSRCSYWSPVHFYNMNWRHRASERDIPVLSP